MRCVVLFLPFLLITFEAYALEIYKCNRDYFVSVTKENCNDEELTCPLPEINDKPPISSDGSEFGYMMVLFKNYAVLESVYVDASGWHKDDKPLETVWNKLEGTDYEFKRERDGDKTFRPVDNFLRLYPVEGTERKMRADIVSLGRHLGEATWTAITSWSCTEAY